MTKRIVLYADDGMVLTDGNIYGTQIFLEEGLSGADFHEISMDEYKSLFPEEEDNLEEQENLEDLA